MKLVTILGARPQFVKAAALSRAIASDHRLNEIIVHTGQHYDANMSDIFFEQMAIPKPNHFLNINSPTHGAMTGRMIEGIEKVLLAEKPDVVLVYGDTNSTLAGAIAARKLNIMISHVEAGLRSYNMQMPEEINRILADRISDLLFCPGEQAVRNLRNEGFGNFAAKIFDVGDIMKDVAYFYRDKEQQPAFEIPQRFFLTTIHRAENTDDSTRLSALIDTLNAAAEFESIVLPIHPRTRARLMGSTQAISSRIKIVDPVGYLEMIYLLKRCSMVITDSGGLQKEAYFFEKPCVTTREQTEWTELVDKGYNIVTGIEKNKVIGAIESLRRRQPVFEPSLYGNGRTAYSIVDLLIKHAGKQGSVA